MHKYGGYYTAFGNMKRFCRFCLLHRSDISSTNSDLFLRREQVSHDHIVDVIESASHVSSIRQMFGISRRSILSSIPNFHVCTKLPPDLMHTEFEGELKRELCLFLKTSGLP